MLMNNFIKLIFMLLAIAYFTLMERKVLSLSQMRLGPNKTSMIGILQPILDGIKLLKKFLILPLNSMVLFLMITSILMLIISLFLWFIYPFFSFINKNHFFLWILLIFGMLSYFILMIGWTSLNKFSYLGGARGVSQSLSFEILILLLIVTPFMITNKASLTLINQFSVINVNLMFIFFFLSILECQRSPMDLSEGESELVSGYNIELSSVMFIFIFLSEYNTMIFMMSIMWFIYLKMMSLLLCLSLFLMLLIRSCFPRIRYDHLMFTFWLKVLPLIILILMIMVNFKQIFNFSGKSHMM
uniref:NADH-ubiquinone oxidoreductase chain 1 n=1 Tax=Romanomermis culicivorax TaxID=13658 RepID=A1EHG3_ROMCU|nr:NADH dehydrogenase subunit 1 [Romanomermis culicivorax]ABL11592.1 NADH dehydrogenase subunit 1 [Romanomermis culicivorax]